MTALSQHLIEKKTYFNYFFRLERTFLTWYFYLKIAHENFKFLYPCFFVMKRSSVTASPSLCVHRVLIPSGLKERLDLRRFVSCAGKTSSCPFSSARMKFGCDSWISDRGASFQGAGCIGHIHAVRRALLTFLPPARKNSVNSNIYAQKNLTRATLTYMGRNPSHLCVLRVDFFTSCIPPSLYLLHYESDA